jgi:hypothetical protein
MGRAVTIIACTAALGAGLAAVPAIAGGPGTPKVTGAKQKDGPYALKQNVRIKRAKSLYVKVKSTHDQNQTATLAQNVVGPGDADYQIDWFRGDEDISHDVQTSGYDFPLKPEKAKIFRVRVKPEADAPRKLCLYSNVQVDVPSTGTNGAFFAIKRKDVCEP